MAFWKKEEAICYLLGIQFLPSTFKKGQKVVFGGHTLKTYLWDNCRNMTLIVFL
jgi:hypothetical protein